MNILILGGTGFLGQRLADALVANGRLAGRTISRIVLADLVQPASEAASALPIERVFCDITRPSDVAAILDARIDMIFHLAAVSPDRAEISPQSAYDVNVGGMLNLLERCRSLGTHPTLVFASSLAVFGGDVPNPIDDSSYLNPQSSFGTQKAMAEALLNDYARRGHVRGRGFRLPAITVRAAPTGAETHALASRIIREPLSGHEVDCPVPRDFLHYCLSTRLCIENLILGAEIPQETLGRNCCMIMPGRTYSIGQMIDAMTEVAGPGPAQLIRWSHHPETHRVLSGWRYDFHPDKALSLGLRRDADFRDIVSAYLEEAA